MPARTSSRITNDPGSPLHCPPVNTCTGHARHGHLSPVHRPTPARRLKLAAPGRTRPPNLGAAQRTRAPTWPCMGQHGQVLCAFFLSGRTKRQTTESRQQLSASHASLLSFVNSSSTFPSLTTWAGVKRTASASLKATLPVLEPQQLK